MRYRHEDDDCRNQEVPSSSATLISGAHRIFPYLQTGLLCGGVESAAIETAVNIAHILNERPLPGSAVATPNGVNWANADWPLRINADQQRERRDLVVSGPSAFGG